MSSKHLSWRDRDIFWIGAVVGLIAGAFLGAVTVYTADALRPAVIESRSTEEQEQLRAMRRLQQYVKQHPDVTLDDLDALTPERLAELYPEIQ